jgi:cyclophilin family peptidyl-prolyl cis-trans isomerase
MMPFSLSFLDRECYEMAEYRPTTVLAGDLCFTVARNDYSTEDKTAGRQYWIAELRISRQQIPEVMGMQARGSDPPQYARLSVATGLVTCLILSTVLLGCDGDTAPPSNSEERSGKTTPGTVSSASPTRPQQVNLEHPIVRIETNVGAITLRLDAVNAPGTVRNFLNCASEGFYDNTLIHYVAPGEMLLAGGYQADNKPMSPRTPIRNEAHNGLKNLRGTIAMTRDVAFIDSATSQFFINLADAPQRDHQGDTPELYGYCVFGEVTDGLDVADRIAQSPTKNMGGDLLQTPDPPVIVTSVRVVP